MPVVLLNSLKSDLFTVVSNTDNNKGIATDMEKKMKTFGEFFRVQI